MVEKLRLDLLLVDRGLCASREKARRVVMAGEVFSKGTRLLKASLELPRDTPLEVRQPERYVGRGGLKLEAALKAFAVDPSGRVCLDAGASTGGFTDCLLQHGAAKVHAFDVGHGQLAWKIRNDPRVVVREHFNLRHLQRHDVGEEIGLIVVDLSFISLTLVLSPLASVLSVRGEMIALIKPQFELARGQVGRGGVVRDAALHAAAVERVEGYVRAAGWEWAGVVASPITGMDGNQEFLCHLRP